LEEDAAKIVQKFDAKLEEIKKLEKDSWKNKLNSQHFISEEQLLVLGKVNQSVESHDCAKILKAMNKMIRIGSLSPNTSSMTEKSKGVFIKVRGLSS
jgi:hypothetical protein